MAAPMILYVLSSFFIFNPLITLITPICTDEVWFHGFCGFA